MGKLNIYQGLSNEYKVIEGNGKLKTLLTAYEPKLDWSKAVVLKEGEKLEGDYTVKDDDILFVRYAAGAAVAVTCAIISVVVAGISLGVSVYAAYQQQKYQKEMEEEQKKSKALSEQTTQLPFIKGAQNRTALGYNIPYIMGSMYDVPYKLTQGFYAIEGTGGTQQYWLCNFIVGYNNAVIQDAYAGTTKIRSATGSITNPDESKISIISDTASTPLSFDTDCAYYDSYNKLDVKYTGSSAIDGVEAKVKGTSYGDSLDYSSLNGEDTYNLDTLTTAQINALKGVTKQLDNHTYKTEVCVAFDGLRVYDGGWKAKSVSFDVYYTTGDGTWTRIATITTGNVNTRSTVRYNTTITFTAAQCYGKDISIRIIRRTETDTNGNESAYLTYINNWIYDANESSSTSIVACDALDEYWRNKTTRLSLKIIANDSTSGTLDEINCNVYGKARVWTGSAWSTEKYPTRNPAAWILELMTSDIHSHSQFTDSEIDLEELGAMYTYCATNKFYCDGIITDDTKKSDIISSILAESNTTMYMSAIDGLWHFAIEQKQSTAVALLNEQCIKNITVTKSFERKPYAYKTTYTDRTDWAVNTIYQDSDTILDSSAVYGLKKLITEAAPKYITTSDHAYKYAHRALAKQKLQPREITVQVGHEGDYYPLYSKVLLQAQQLKIGLSSGIIKGVTTKAGLITAISVSELCDLTDTSLRYGVIIQSMSDYGKEHLYAEIVPNGLVTRDLTLSSYLSYTILPQYGNVYTFGYLNSDGTFTKLTNEMMIYATKENESGWELTLKDYNDAIFEYGTVPTYTPNLTTKKETSSRMSVPTYGDLAEAKLEAVASQKNVASITLYWAVSETNTSAPTSGWSTTAPDMDETNRYLWGYTKYTYSDGTYLETTPCVLGVHGAQGAAGSGFLLDLSEETFALLDTTIETEGSSFSTTASLFHDSVNYSKHSGVSYSATLNGVEQPSTYWTDNTITVPCANLSTTTDTNTLIITCTYNITIDDVQYEGTITAQATISKLYSGQSPTVYKMLVSDSQLTQNEAGDVSPDTITVQKKKINTVGESDTNSGYVTAEYNDSGTEVKVDNYANQASETYDSTATYYSVVEPFVLSLDEDTSLSADVAGNGNDSNGTTVAAVFYD